MSCQQSGPRQLNFNPLHFPVDIMFIEDEWDHVHKNEKLTLTLHPACLLEKIRKGKQRKEEEEADWRKEKADRIK